VLSLRWSLLTKVLDEGEKGIDTICTPGGKQKMAIINEPGLYSLILRTPYGIDRPCSSDHAKGRPGLLDTLGGVV